MARAGLNWTVRELAEKADVSHDTVIRIEAGQTLKANTIEKVRLAFEAEGIAFTNGGEPGVKFKTVKGGEIFAPARLGRKLD